ncbi:MAG: metal-dependent hydrolase [Candidatus Magasanikbacteria bacterium CG_4_10_14_0_2_um_filter_37_12]|uniref:Metal-dependent hydrolase n=1 Tax=Candidatus Magasanikbacteria bacterium CG_4_10_14_0_2_um_filter_37_12 TaxID=1974637 RepID=A0A2M7V6V0_9BACT|nr:MAG: metal-dependent hydrolase [Candidatus Magasanikbacteria bacterium CG_4_10_14_0_2_um_filter_37_12]
MDYKLKHYKRSKYIRITISSKAGVLVTAPKWVGKKEIERFVIDKQDWIEKNKSIIKDRLSKQGKKEKIFPPFATCGARAKKLIRDRLYFFNKHYHFSFQKISVRDQKTRWGSCSSAGTLSFNYRLFFVPLELCDYVVVHELCHTKEMNHSAKFWKMVSETIPDYRALQVALRKFGLATD